jgi:hypothetical protein
MRTPARAKSARGQRLPAAHTAPHFAPRARVSPPTDEHVKAYLPSNVALLVSWREEQAAAGRPGPSSIPHRSADSPVPPEELLSLEQALRPASRR